MSTNYPPHSAISALGVSGSKDSGRIGYIDAMRGFSMILVVFGHVLLMMGYPTDSTVLGAILLTFRMPLFFFVSGFFAYRAMDRWSKSFTRNVVKRKIQAQVICTLVFFSLFQLCHSESPLLFLHEGFSWFWFTIVLFQMFIIYLSLALIEKKLNLKYFIPISLIVLALVFFFIFVKSPSWHSNFPIGLSQIWEVLSWSYFVEYFQYFALGILARKYSHIFTRSLENDKFRTWTLIIYVATLIGAYGLNGALENYNSAISNLVKMLIVRYAGLFTVFILFNSNRTYFESNDKPCKWLRFVGRRTLDIYMLHVFFLPKLGFMKDFLEGQFLLQLTIGIIFAILVVALCLFISTVIRSSTFLSQWLFGEKPKTSLTSAILVP